ncbi:putative high-affinity branched-chain amino acid transporter, membrane component of ABC transporter (livH-like) (plasmid) [Methylorubrum extorquens DM4]|uniref:High-affinity branched-chain amino acid transporter, membrane component of ABC transporter (LivH-like) n=1 Tax=Methylorubrum extorquens (strain DSM 6343 / CIP 106787 / DM4) TaxID=661410 RepID=C7CN24_METED|nr:branched-chain amino acid ABC transporter permease [Methylorubrum extorquens]CAX17054.1 putative high-affinity branched-chain amino acid transporter, membrane component of ABC transporter (livH-like) [Methylorubrum extorquens DM4]
MNAFLGAAVDGILYAAWLFNIAVGLTLIYGVMKILNMAHGTFYAIGAYLGATLLGLWFSSGLPSLGSLAMIPVAALVAGLAVGVAVERGVLRIFAGRDPVVLLLVTYALFLILEDGIKLIWGVDPYVVSEPMWLLGTVRIGPLVYPAYNLLTVAAAILVGVGLTWFLQFTSRGKILRAVIHDEEVSHAMGIPVSRWKLSAFVVGTGLAALGGALTAPTVSVVPAMGVEVIVMMFAVVVIGGLGSIPGTVVGALIVGLVRSAAVHYWPEVELFSIYAVMALVLAVRPKGLFSGVELRKI